MAKARVIDPCRLKGRYLGSRSSGRSYTNSVLGIKIAPSGCECREAFRCFTSGNSFLSTQTSYALDLKSKSPRTNFKPARSGLTVVSRELLAVPCQRTFLKPDSDGTKAYRELNKQQNDNSAFLGCEDLDRYLIENGLLNYDIREGTGTNSDVQNALEVLDYEDEIRDLNYDVLFTKFSNRNGSKLFTNHDELRTLSNTLENTHIRGLQVESTPSIDALLGEDRNSYDDVFENKLAKALRLLTPHQRKAVRLVYLENGEGKTQGAIAKELGISLPSLRDRLSGAFNKIAAEFQDLFPGFTKKEKKKRWTPKRKPAIPFPIRITSHGVTREFIPTEKKPRPLGPLRKRIVVDQDQMIKKIWAERRYVRLF